MDGPARKVSPNVPVRDMQTLKKMRVEAGAASPFQFVVDTRQRDISAALRDFVPRVMDIFFELYGDNHPGLLCSSFDVTKRVDTVQEGFSVDKVKMLGDNQIEITYSTQIPFDGISSSDIAMLIADFNEYGWYIRVHDSESVFPKVPLTRRVLVIVDNA